MSSSNVGGAITIKVDGEEYEGKGSFTFYSGYPKNEIVMGNKQVAGKKVMPTEPGIDGKITDINLDLKKLYTLEGATVTGELSNGRRFIYRNAWYAGDPQLETEEGEVDFKIRSKKRAEIINPRGE